MIEFQLFGADCFSCAVYGWSAKGWSWAMAAPNLVADFSLQRQGQLGEDIFYVGNFGVKAIEEDVVDTEERLASVDGKANHKIEMALPCLTFVSALPSQDGSQGSGFLAGERSILIVLPLLRRFPCRIRMPPRKS